MHTSDYCRLQAEQVRELASQTTNDIEATMLDDISASWAKLARQIQTYVLLKENRTRPIP